MQGRRVYPRADGELWLLEGDYGFDPRAGRWYACAPGGLLGDLSNHTVTEHEDSTISVSPSILITSHDASGETIQWHGYLVRGVWREC